MLRCAPHLVSGLNSFLTTHQKDEDVMQAGLPSPLRFGQFEFDRASGELRKRGLRVRLTPHAKVLLRALLDPPIRAQTREELQRLLWPGQSFLDFEHGLNKVVHSLRDALGDSGQSSRFIETVTGGGYRFVPEWLKSDSSISNSPKGGAGSLIAVLPFQVFDTSPELIFLGSLIVSDLNNALSSIDGIRVLAQSTVRSHYTAGASPQMLGERMGVRAVLYGEILNHDSDVFMRLELIDVSDGTQLSSALVDRPFSPGQPFARGLLDEILRQLRPALLTLAPPARSAVAS
jgi:DNA-binding winged helix-turn-helix (wHTH) protein